MTLREGPNEVSGVSNGQRLNAASMVRELWGGWLIKQTPSKGREGDAEMKVCRLAEVPYVDHAEQKGIRQKNALKNVAGGFELLFSRMEPGGMGSMHSHAGYEHVLFVLRGKLRASTPDSQAELAEGELVYFAPGEPHEVRNGGEGPLEYLVLYVPKRK